MIEINHFQLAAAKAVALQTFRQFSPTGGCQPDTLTITWPMAGVAMALLFVLVVGGAMWTMRKRDIT